jgi:hypothetical protein
MSTVEVDSRLDRTRKLLVGISFLDGSIDVAARLTLYSGLKTICISKPDCVAETTVTYPTLGSIAPDLCGVLVEDQYERRVMLTFQIHCEK